MSMVIPYHLVLKMSRFGGLPWQILMIGGGVDTQVRARDIFWDLWMKFGYKQLSGLKIGY